jgi:hypothetical protein
MWKDCERLQSSTWGELYAIEFSLRSFAPVLEGSHVKWFTDNQAAAKIVEVGSMKFELHKMARRIFEICISSGIYLEVQWIPRDQNQQADYVSRLLDTDDWQTTDDLFLSLDARWGPHSIDCFANYYNHKLPRFFSRFWNPNTAGVDFFIQPLRGENCWVDPPVSVIPRVLHYMKYQRLSALWLYHSGRGRIIGRGLVAKHPFPIIVRHRMTRRHWISKSVTQKKIFYHKKGSCQ